jgi:hypothetical protein
MRAALRCLRRASRGARRNRDREANFYENGNPGRRPLFKAEHLPSLHLLLMAGRFSDMLRMLEVKRLQDLHFTVENEADGSWPVFS